MTALVTEFLESFFFFLNDTAPTEIYPLPLHAALPISPANQRKSLIGKIDNRRGKIELRVQPGFYSMLIRRSDVRKVIRHKRSEEHTSELQSQSNLVCRLLLEKKKKILLMLIRLTRKHY